MKENKQKCPNCGYYIPVYPGFTSWCENCGWNIEIRIPEPVTILENIHRSFGKKFSHQLHNQMMSGSSIATSFSVQRVLAWVIAAFINGMTLVFFVTGFLLVVQGIRQSMFALTLFGVFCAALGLVFLPRLEKVPSQLFQRDRFPTLFEIADRISDELRASRIDEIAYSLEYNASYGQYGIKRKRILTIGLPLVAVLDGNELVALLSHELSHGVNKDPQRGLFFGTAIYSLGAWFELLGNWRTINFLTIPIVMFLWLLGYGLSFCIWFDTQRSEYLADILATKICGTDSFIKLLEKCQLVDTFVTNLKAAFFSKKGDLFFSRLKAQIETAPRRELERINKIEEKLHTGIDVSHPRTTKRIEFLKTNSVSIPKFHIPEHELEKLKEELAPLLHEAEKYIFSLDDLSFRYIFRIIW